jgi:hypothetical protein
LLLWLVSLHRSRVYNCSVVAGLSNPGFKLSTSQRSRR